MSMSFFADHCVSNFIIKFLQDEGHSVLQLKDYIPADSDDKAALSKAQGLDSIMISLNGDFSDIITYPPQLYKGIIALQVRNHPEIIPKLMERLKNYLFKHSNMNHYTGKLILVEVHRIRVR